VVLFFISITAIIMAWAVAAVAAAPVRAPAAGAEAWGQGHNGQQHTYTFNHLIILRWESI
ncbi:hypothetical protein, partial [Serratia marcescens]|uniref:hypothetical protein n=1 Tax=Serratia marcescens TaxID=615 RepID=UPI001C8CF257